MTERREIKMGTLMKDRVNDVIEGLRIIHQYEGARVDAEHDTIYAGGDAELREEHVAKMAYHGWSFEEGIGWSFFT